MKFFKVTFKSNPDLVVHASDTEHAKEVAARIHEFEGVETSEVLSVAEVKTLGDLLGI